MLFLGYTLIPPPAPPFQGRPCKGWGYPNTKINVNFEIPTIKNPIIDVFYAFLVYTLIPPCPPPSRGRPCKGWGYPNTEINTIFEIPTIKNPRFDI